MAEEDKSQEKTEEATPKRLEKAREEGQVARSRELNTSAILLTGTIFLSVFAASFAKAMISIARQSFSFDRMYIQSPSLMISYFENAFMTAVGALLPFFVTLFIAGFIGSIVMGGASFSASSLMPKFSRLNPLEGIKKMASMNSLVELAKSIVKVTMISSLAVLILFSQQADLLSISAESPRDAIVHAVSILGWVAIALAAATILIAIVDVPWQIYQHSEKMKMTMQEVKDEMKDTEGKPEVKGRIRRMQMEIAQRRMMGEVPEADVVITNPSHFSVALKYNQSEAQAPVVVAKGADLIAQKIREVAEAHDVPILQAPPLARAIFYTTELEQEIPEGLYLAVAQVLAYVFQLKTYKPGRGKRPVAPRRYDIPDDLQH